MNFKTTIVLLIALLVVGSFFLFTPKSPNPSAEQATQTPPGQGKKLIDLQSAQVKGITIIDADGNRTSIRQDGASWKMNEPVSAAAVDWQTQDLIRTICDLRSQGQPDPPPPDAGLDKPQYTIDLIGSDDKSTRLIIGNKTSIGDVMYAKVDSGDVNLIDSSLAKTLKTAADDLRDKHLLTAGTTDIKQIRIITPTQILEAVKQGEHWQITKPNQIPGDSESISSLVSTIIGTEATEFVKSDSDELAFARFDHPTMQIVLSSETPATQPSTEPSTTSASDLTLTIGAPDSLAKDHYFVKTSSGLVAKIAKSSLDILQKGPLDLRDRNVVTIAGPDVTSVSVVKTTYPPLSSTQATQPSAANMNQRPMSTHLVVLGRRPKEVKAIGPSLSASRPTTVPATQAAKSIWMFAIPSEPNSLVDDSKVDALLDKFSPLRADKYLEKAPDTAVDQKYIVTLETKSLNKYHIEVLKPVNNATPYATYNGLTFEVPTTLLDTLDADLHKTP